MRVCTRQLTRDVPGRHTLFYRNLPINIKKWIRALGSFDIDTYTPSVCSMQHVPERFVADVKAHLPLFNEVTGFVPFFTELKCRLGEKGIALHEFATVEDFTQAQVYFSRKHNREEAGIKILANGALKGLPSLQPQGSKARSPLTLKTDAFAKRLAVDEILGVIFRGGHVTAVGSGRTVASVVMIDEHGALIKRFEADTHIPLILGAAMMEETEIIWVAKSTRVPAQTEPEAIRNSTSIDMDLSFELTVADFAVMRHPEVCNLANVVAGGIIKGLRQGTLPRPEALNRSGVQGAGSLPQALDLIKLITNDLKRRSSEQSPPAQKATDPGTLPAEKAIEPVWHPTLCRNAWILHDKSTSEALDTVKQAALRSRRRLYRGLRCKACVPEHPDRLQTEKFRCKLNHCLSKFELCSTTTHYIYKNAAGARVEEDVNLPLFTDVALKGLKRAKKG